MASLLENLSTKTNTPCYDTEQAEYIVQFFLVFLLFFLDVANQYMMQNVTSDLCLDFFWWVVVYYNNISVGFQSKFQNDRMHIETGNENLQIIICRY